MARFLVLPGYLQSGKLMAEKSSGFRKLMTKLNHQLEFIDPPVLIKSYKELSFTLGETEEECQLKWDKIVDNNSNRCWFQHDEKLGYTKFNESHEYLINYLNDNGPYDGIIGFSQGSGMMLTVLYSVKLKFELKLGVSFSGFIFTQPIDETKYDRVNINYQIEDVLEYSENVRIVPEYKNLFLFDHSNTLKVFNIYGSNDMLVPNIRSKYIDSVFPKVEDFEFDGGHMMPNKKPFLNPLIEKIQDHLKNYQPREN